MRGFATAWPSCRRSRRFGRARPPLGAVHSAEHAKRLVALVALQHGATLGEQSSRDHPRLRLYRPRQRIYLVVRQLVSLADPAIPRRCGSLRCRSFPASASWTTSAWTPTRVVAIPNGVGRQFVPADPQTVEETRRRLGLPRQYVLSVGSLQPRKNLPRLLEAWRRLPVVDWDLSLVLVGATGQTFRSVQLAGDAPNVEFAGYVSDQDLAAVYTGAAMFVFPSLYEGFGLPVLEAMACGTPVVCSSATALPEVVGDAGILVDPYDPDSIADGIRRMWKTRRCETL